MGLVQWLSSAFRKNSPQGASSSPNASSASANSTSPPPRPKTLAELEREMEEQAKVAAQQSRQSSQSAKRGGKFIRRLKWTVVLVGVPAGALAIANLPFPPIREAVSDTAPTLLLPSYLMMDHSFRQAVALVEQSRQLIDSPTSAADLELGAQKLKQAQSNLNSLPIGLTRDQWIADWYGYGWFGPRMTIASLNRSRADVGRLEAKVFQEQNAQATLVQIQVALNEAKQQVQEAAMPVEKQGAIAAWRDALNQLRQIPPETLAGRMAQQTLATERPNFEAIAGQAVGDQQTSAMITAAQGFALQAAQLSQNPPHPAETWEQVEGLWQQAIDRLGAIRPTDPTSYAEAQNLMATYQGNLSQIKIRKQAEVESVRALEQAKQEYAQLIASLPASGGGLDPNVAIGRIQGIMNSLDRVQQGTTVYTEAQTWIRSAQNKVRELQSKL